MTNDIEQPVRAVAGCRKPGKDTKSDEDTAGETVQHGHEAALEGALHKADAAQQGQRDAQHGLQQTLILKAPKVSRGVFAACHHNKQLIDGSHLMGARCAASSQQHMLT